MLDLFLTPLTNPFESFADLCANFVLLLSMVQSGFIYLLNANCKVLQCLESTENLEINKEYTNAAQYNYEEQLIVFKSVSSYFNMGGCCPGLNNLLIRFWVNVYIYHLALCQTDRLVEVEELYKGCFLAP